MNKTLAFVGFLAGMSNVFGMDISTEKPNFECDDEEWSGTCRKRSPENLKEYVADTDCP